MKYKQLTHQERDQISVLKGIGLKKKDIAKTLGRHVSTIYRELKRNKDRRGYYYHRKAHEYAVARRADNGKRAIRINELVWGYIEYQLEKQWSPEQISHFSGVSHEHIYQYIYKNKRLGGDLYLNLRRQRVKRPKVGDKRSRLGDFEVDTIIGSNRKSALVSIVERKSGLCLIKKSAKKQPLQ